MRSELIDRHCLAQISSDVPSAWTTSILVEEEVAGIVSYTPFYAKTLETQSICCTQELVNTSSSHIVVEVDVVDAEFARTISSLRWILVSTTNDFFRPRSDPQGLSSTRRTCLA